MDLRKKWKIFRERRLCYIIIYNDKIYKKYKIIYTKECKKEMKKIFNYITINLNAREQANHLFSIIKQRIKDLELFPDMYIKIDQYNKIKKKYHKMVVKNYIILYTIDDENHKVFISHIFYQRRNYLHLL